MITSEFLICEQLCFLHFFKPNSVQLWFSVWIPPTTFSILLKKCFRNTDFHAVQTFFVFREILDFINRKTEQISKFTNQMLYKFCNLQNVWVIWVFIKGIFKMLINAKVYFLCQNLNHTIFICNKLWKPANFVDWEIENADFGNKYRKKNLIFEIVAEICDKKCCQIFGNMMGTL